MRLLITTALASIVLVFSIYRGSLLAVDDNPTAERTDRSPSKTLLSDSAVVRGIVYTIELEGDRLFLTSRPLVGDDRELKRSAVEFTLAPEDQIVDISLARMTRHLAGIVKVRRGETFDFYCVTLICRGDHVRDGFRVYREKFFTTRDDLEILALRCKSNSVFAVVGEMDFEGDSEPHLISNGVIYSMSCPWPPMGVVSPYHAKSPDAKAN